MKHYVYILLNEAGTVEYVGRTKNPKRRMSTHKCKPSGNHGQFHSRDDISMEIVKEFGTKREALDYEGQLKLDIGFEWTERTAGMKGGKIGGRITGLKYGRINGKKSSKPVLVYDKNGFVGEFPSQNEFAKLYNLHQAAVNRVVLGKQKTTGGFIIRNK